MFDIIKDELLWASAWLYRATNDETYLNYLGGSGTTGGTRTMFSWDDKYAGVQILAAKVILFLHIFINYTLKVRSIRV